MYVLPELDLAECEELMLFGPPVTYELADRWLALRDRYVRINAKPLDPEWVWVASYAKNPPVHH